MENKLAAKNNYYKSDNIEAPLEKEEEFTLIEKWQKYSDKKSLNRKWCILCLSPDGRRWCPSRAGRYRR